MSTDKDWEAWGKENPYYGVISQDKFLGKVLTKTARQEFYRSGEGDIDYIFSHIHKIRPSKAKFRLAVDYGCGVGRLTLPLSKYARRVIGYDISPSMIESARTANAANKTVDFKVIEKSFSNLPDSFDFLNSYIVFQHIPPQIGMKILKQLFGRLEAGGYFSLQLTFGYDRSLLGKTLLYLRERFLPIRYIANLARGRKYNTPNMRMHSYDLNEFNELLFKSNIKEYSTVLTNHGGYWGVFIFGKKD